MSKQQAKQQKRSRRRATSPKVNLGASPTARLMSWFDATRRDLPWRSAPGEKRDPYRVWLSEIMLQQTQVTTATPYFEAFVERWADVAALAGAADDDVFSAWAGLGYYARARNLIKCARHVAFELGGRFPETEAGLLELPGVGAYTAPAIAAIAFNQPTAPVDGNIARVLARRLTLETPLPGLKGEIRPEVEKLLPAGRPGDFAEALMDLGAGVCKPKKPDCPRCPWTGDCRAEASGTPERWPRRKVAKPKPTRRGWVFWLEREPGDGDKNSVEVFIVRRPQKGLLGAMMAFPTTDWAEGAPDTDIALDEADGLFQARKVAESAFASFGNNNWQALDGRVRHTFTHFSLELGVVCGRIDGGAIPAAGVDGVWCPEAELGSRALPSVMAKVARLVGEGKTGG